MSVTTNQITGVHQMEKIYVIKGTGSGVLNEGAIVTSPESLLGNFIDDKVLFEITGDNIMVKTS